MAEPAIPKPPAGLSRRSRALWRDTVDEFELSASELFVLENGLRCLDRADEAAAVVNREGVTVLDRYGSPKAHPAVDVEVRCRAAFNAAMRQLAVKVTDDAPVRRGARTGPSPRLAQRRSG
jgi:hypothetical protein